MLLKESEGVLRLLAGLFRPLLLLPAALLSRSHAPTSESKGTRDAGAKCTGREAVRV